MAVPTGPSNPSPAGTVPQTRGRLRPCSPPMSDDHLSVAVSVVLAFAGSNDSVAKTCGPLISSALVTNVLVSVAMLPAPFIVGAVNTAETPLQKSCNAGNQSRPRNAGPRLVACNNVCRQMGAGIPLLEYAPVNPLHRPLWPLAPGVSYWHISVFNPNLA